MWRVGRKLGRTLYYDDVCVGMVDSPAVAARIVAAMNAAEAMTGDGKVHNSVSAEPARKAVCKRCGGTTAVESGSIRCGAAYRDCPDCAKPAAEKCGFCGGAHPRSVCREDE